MKETKRITVALTGASGSIYAVRLVEALRRLDVEVGIVASAAGCLVLRQECGRSVENLAGPGAVLYEDGDIAAPIASGSFPVDGMVVAPCTMNTLAAVASGRADTLMHRAADVTLKERRPLILVARETPLNRIHIENMLRAHDAGATILPAMPPLYGGATTVEELADHLVGRILDQLAIENDLAPRWGE